ncbi:MAG: leucine-rich repeat protein [Alphaproteobacteria bacterium]|nr:MAG: leucine-rich repeat protein [Alphaproteobacteria bacterium]
MLFPFFLPIVKPKPKLYIKIHAFYHLNATSPAKAIYAHSPAPLSGQHSQAQEQVAQGSQEACDAPVGAAAAAAADTSAAKERFRAIGSIVEPLDPRPTTGLQMLGQALAYIPEDERIASLLFNAKHRNMVFASLALAREYQRFDHFLEFLSLQALERMISIFFKGNDKFLEKLDFFWARKEGSSSAFFATQEDFININTLTTDNPVVRKMQMIIAHKFPDDVLYVHKTHIEDVARQFCQAYAQEYKTLDEIDFEQEGKPINYRFGLKPNSHILITPQDLQDHKVNIETVSNECPDVTFVIHCKDEVLTQGFDLPETKATFVLAGNVKEIGVDAFKDKTLGSKLDLSNVKRIGKWAFRGATFTKGIKLYSDVVLEGGAFHGAIFKEDVNLPNVKIIGKWVFLRATFMKGLTLKDDVVMEEQAFEQCIFESCPYFSNLKFSDETKIEKNAFQDAIPEKTVCLSKVSNIQHFLKRMHRVSSYNTLRLNYLMISLGLPLDCAYRYAKIVLSIHHILLNLFKRPVLNLSHTFLRNIIFFCQFAQADRRFMNATFYENIIFSATQRPHST